MEDVQEKAVTRVPPSALAEPEGPPKLYRHRANRAVAGVAAGLAEHLGVRVLWVRAVFAVLAAFGGAGLLAYGLLWVFVPQKSGEDASRPSSPKERQQAIGLLVLGIGLAVGGSTFSGAISGWVAVPLAVALVGAAVVWREADESQRRRWRAGARSGVAEVVLGGGGWSAVVRILAGVALVITGIGVVVLRSGSFDQVQFALIAVVATLVGVAVLTIPFWLRMVRDLGEERRARIRTEERAEIAAHLHDSVLQTLALIQKQSDAPKEVARLARGQERELRGWLYGPSGYGGKKALTEDGGRLSAAIATACGEVEDAFAISVSQVVVGDADLDEPLLALVQAAREAIVNAAKHAGVEEVSVYAEAEPTAVTVFVRDRGKGFDPEEVSEDRHGLADSIRGRMERNGGTVRLRTAPGDGTEVQLEMPIKTGSNA
ncbi:signal transduction histidine kinase/phage shock protein PspC (stress-responsive transcriptional regulator) [Amycolatopsis bartoniae]|uniref:Histidine kinase n=1 Tax=Amycolatopsis bartoniae TaxID=941986 RepID=A0A8H9J0U6_9PSEU|nr:ATP-binding protein [Amycolatopsis bartoniae]MBB2933929.1 signal transduction histidine kinase/phage shock protein PspC (stress-responsive transcriptional regulator) [Amycolatopsis bartoniae]TVT01483.1 PspC domain-containing protein [Amycolatopsis bartoniae]GHF88069.1 histidine kinase [Amycolatopsis bartoniae]